MKSLNKNTELVYRWNDPMQSYLFATIERAIQIDKIHRALWNAKTWQDLKQSVHADDFKFLMEMFCENSERERNPELGAMIDWEFLDENIVADAIYPPFLIYEMEDVLPKAVLEQYGELVITMHDGAYYRMGKETVQPLIQALIDLGYSVSRGDEFIFDDFA